jgi:hypothetical protein
MGTRPTVFKTKKSISPRQPRRKELYIDPRWEVVAIAQAFASFMEPRWIAAWPSLRNRFRSWSVRGCRPRTLHALPRGSGLQLPGWGTAESDLKIARTSRSLPPPIGFCCFFATRDTGLLAFSHDTRYYLSPCTPRGCRFGLRFVIKLLFPKIFPTTWGSKSET